MQSMRHRKIVPRERLQSFVLGEKSRIAHSENDKEDAHDIGYAGLFTTGAIFSAVDGMM
jgi:hypothetical protein